jgi:hypothetical protein
MSAELAQPHLRDISRQVFLGEALTHVSENSANMPELPLSVREAGRLRRSAQRVARTSNVLSAEFAALPRTKQTEVGLKYRGLVKEDQLQQRRDAARVGSAVSLLKRKGLLTSEDVDATTGHVDLTTVRHRLAQSGLDPEKYEKQLVLLKDHSLSAKSKLRQEARAHAEAPIITIDPSVTTTSTEERKRNRKKKWAVRTALAGATAVVLAACSGIGGLFSGDNGADHRGSATSSARTNPFASASATPTPADSCILFTGVDAKPVVLTPASACESFKQPDQNPTQGDGKGQGETGKGAPAEVPPTPSHAVRRVVAPAHTPEVPQPSAAPTSEQKKPTPTSATPTPESTPPPKPPKKPTPTPIPSPTCTPTPPPPPCSPSPSPLGHH